MTLDFILGTLQFQILKKMVKIPKKQGYIELIDLRHGPQLRYEYCCLRL